MATPELSRKERRHAVREVEKRFKRGFRPPGSTGHGLGAVTVTANELGWTRGKLEVRLRAAAAMGITPDKSLYVPPTATATATLRAMLLSLYR